MAKHKQGGDASIEELKTENAELQALVQAVADAAGVDLEKSTKPLPQCIAEIIEQRDQLLEMNTRAEEQVAAFELALADGEISPEELVELKARTKALEAENQKLRQSSAAPAAARLPEGDVQLLVHNLTAYTQQISHRGLKVGAASTGLLSVPVSKLSEKGESEGFLVPVKVHKADVQGIAQACNQAGMTVETVK